MPWVIGVSLLDINDSPFFLDIQLAIYAQFPPKYLLGENVVTKPGVLDGPREGKGAD
jgi:hypothetical protein